ncbi:MAG TPA: N,N-dimethylformamidase beta subunit family domain-containing protein, partial [Isosphaeraceae bacterium]
SPGIEGYASRTSVRPGEALTLHVSTNPSSPFVIDVYRLGYYQGHGGRHVLRLGPFRGAVQPDPPIGPMRLRECGWMPCTTLTIPGDWTSGVYLGKLTAEREGVQSSIIFVVRDDRRCDYLVQVSDNTWNAYNRWPSQFSLYDNGAKVWYWGPDVQTSFDRPYGKYCQILDAPLSVGSGEFLLWEFPLAYWMEGNGDDVSYISNADTHADGAGLLRARGWLSVGHDEYWTLQMYDNVKQAIARGLNVAFLSGNSVCGVVPLLPATDGRPHRIITRVGLFGGIGDESEGFPDMKRLTDHGPSEADLIGARGAYPVTGGGDWICRAPDHWLFAGTGMKDGDGIPGLVGWEWHGDPAPIAGLEIVASGPTTNGRVPGTYTATIYPGPKENVVFNAATIWWADGLSEPPGYVRPAVYTKPLGPDPRVQRITRNLLERMRVNS